ncbi:hypothetical protein ZIOFF_068577 [Zingiber officinale]|uniref:t-SNARE coiled-coil homology domain-containing protein n=1 Tax=Zingiber officinale TaxID=94328 RepID=A0A8J5CHI8_ZINOF|nr:hypothetical protein ZIOFF_068577 [Zingiber officinale]
MPGTFLHICQARRFPAEFSWFLAARLAPIESVADSRFWIRSGGSNLRACAWNREGEDEFPGFGIREAAHRAAAGYDAGCRGRAVPDYDFRPQLRALGQHDRHPQGHSRPPGEAVSIIFSAECWHNARLHIGQLVKDASTKLKQATETDHLSEASCATTVETSKRITDAKLAKDFQNILKEYQKLQRLAAERETAFAPLVPQAVLPPRQAVVFYLYDSMGAPDNTSNKPLEHALLLESKRQEVLLLDNEIVFNEAIIEEREQAIQDIQQQIGEVNEIFKDLAVLVHDQGVIIDDISSHIENSHAATAQGTAQLQKAAKTQKSNSSLMCLLLVIFGIILLIVVIVVAT